MLTADLIRPRLARKGGKIWTRPLSTTDPTYTEMAGQIIAIFRQHVGRTRGELRQALADYEGDSLNYPIIRGLAKTVADYSQFASEPPVDPATIRQRLFALAGERGPVVTRPDLLHHTTRSRLLAQVAAEFDLSPDALLAAMYADLDEAQVLQAVWPEATAENLIRQYNLELARGLLYWATEMRITVRGNYKDLFKYVKLFKLMHTIRPASGGGYHLTLDGPISPFVQATTRYGRQFARFLPALLLCDGWRMEADVLLPPPPGTTHSDQPPPPLRYTLDPRSGLRSHYTASGPFDSKLEEDFAAEFERKYGRAKRRWTLAREDEIVPVGDTVMIPDFSFTHVRDGRRALLEIAGFWHPDYIRRKVDKLRRAGRRDLIVLVYEGVNCSRQTWAEVPGEVLYFKNKPVLKDVLAAVERCAVPPAATHWREAPPGRERPG